MSDILQQSDSVSLLSRLSKREEQAPLQSDAELLSLYVEGGKRDAIEVLIKRYSGLVANVCRLTVADPNAAEDAFQATFLVLLKSAKKIRRQESVAAWLHGVAYRTASRIRKKEIALTSKQSCDEVIQTSDSNQEPIAQLARKMELEALNRELENLPERLRAPLVEHYLLGYSAPQIAERMELSTAAVEGRLKRGRRHLRTLLAQRGISLSVLVAGSTLFQKHLSAAEAVSWTDAFLETHLPSQDGIPGDSVVLDSTNPQVSSLVSGELSMTGTIAFKGSLIAGIIFAAGSFAMVASAQSSFWNSGGGGAGQNGTSTGPLSQTTTVLAQLGTTAEEVVRLSSGNSGGGGAPPTVTSSPQNPQPPATPQLDDSSSRIAWQRPDAEGEPIWLAGGNASMQAMEQNRAALAETVEFDYEGVPLSEIVKDLSSKTGYHFELNVPELDLLGVDPDEPITIKGPPTNVRELLRRMLDSLELTYRVTESTIEITSKDAAEAEASMRFYDLSFVLPNASNAASVVEAIQQSVDPDCWVPAGGTSTVSLVGSMMIVTAPDTVHQKIEILLMNLSRMNPKNVTTPTVPGIGTGGGNGMGGGGGMGGAGGGMF